MPRRLAVALGAALVLGAVAVAVIYVLNTQPVEPEPPAPTGSTGPTADPSAAGLPSPVLESGDPRLDGAVWYPPVVDDGSYALVAAADSSPENRERADFAVSGTADDEINAALESLARRGGGQVRLLEGRYELDAPIEISGDGLALVGVNVGNGVGYSEDARGSQILPADGFPDGEFLVTATGDAYGPLISLLHVDGGDRAQGINVEGPRPTVSLVAVTQSSGTGIRFAGESVGQRPYDGYVLFNRVFDGQGVGILHDERSGDMLIEGNIVFRNEGDGFVSRGASQMYRMNHAYNNAGVGIRLVPGCVRTRLTGNKWEGNEQGGLSIEGGNAFTVVGDSFADNDSAGGSSAAHIQIGVRGETETSSVVLSNLAFGKGEDGNPYLIHFGALARDVHVGPVTSFGGYSVQPYLEEPGSEVLYYGPIPDPIVTETDSPS